MKKLFLILSISTLLLNVSLAQSSVWKIEGKGNTVYIGGTMHLLTPDDHPLPPEFDSAYVWSDALVFEADIKKMENPAVIQQMMMLAMYQDDRTLESELSKEAYALLESECSKINLSLSPFAKFKPSMVLLIYTVTKLQESGLTEAGVDPYYYEKALADDKETLFLETVESQLELLFGDEGEDMDQEVFQFFDDLEKMDKMGADIKDNWRSGKSKLLIRIQKQMEKEYPEIYKKALVNRNNNWISQIDTYFDTESVEFVLVGALHLHGDDGILSLLKESGYSISQLE
jgi:uncharacterized protein YbaP (TraB family)